MKTLFPGFSQLINLTDTEINNYYQKLTEYCDLYRYQILTFCTDLYSLDHHKYYQDDLKEDIAHIFGDSAAYEAVLTHQNSDNILNEYLKHFLESSKELIIPRRFFPKIAEEEYMQHQTLKYEIQSEKIQQNLYFTKFINNVLSGDRFEGKPTYLDFGAGKGYLSSFLAFDLQQKTIAIEASEMHAWSLCRRTVYMTLQLFKPIYLYLQSLKGSLYDPTPLSEFQKQQIDNMNFCIKFVDTEVCPGAIEQQSLNLRDFVQQRADRNDVVQGHDKKSNIQGKKAEVLKNATVLNNSEQYIAVGLHACGDLSIIMLKMAVQQKQLKYVFTIPCCYQKLSDAGFPLAQHSEQILRKLESDQYASSSKIKAFQIPLQLLNYACTGFDEPLTYAHETVDSFFNRAVLEKCRNLAGRMDKICLKKKVYIKSELDLINWIYQIVNAEESTVGITRSACKSVKDITNFTVDQIVAVINECSPLKYKMQCHYLFRQVVGQVLESFILVDRLMYIRRHAHLTGQINWCMGGQTSRGFVVWCKQRD